MIYKSEHNTHQTPRQRQFTKLFRDKYVAFHLYPFFLLNRCDFYL